MLDNLKLKQGDRVLIISELLDEMDWFSRLERRTRFKIADAETYVYDIAQRVRSAVTSSRFADEQPQDQGARSVFYYAMPDAYPDEYFDVIWMPQGCGQRSAIPWRTGGTATPICRGTCRR